MTEEELLRSLAVGGATRADSFSGMDPRFRSALANMYGGAPPEIQQQLHIMSGYRSPERQKQLWEQALVKYGSPERARKWVAPPGRSNHNHGYASDLKYGNDAAKAWAHQNAQKYGLSFPLENENWHVELAGVRGRKPHNHADAPVANVMAAADPSRQFTPSAPDNSLASLYSAPGVNPDPLAAQLSVMPADASLGSLAGLFVTQQANKAKQREEEQKADAIRKAALFAPPGGVAGLYG